MNTKFIILGIPPGGLFLARQLRKQWPESMIFAIGDPIHDIGRYSKTIDRFYEVSSQNSVIMAIQRAYKEIGEGLVNAYFCSNPMLECVVGQYPIVFNFLTFENELELYRQLIDKNNLEEVCQRLNINRPKSYDLKETVLDEIVFPVIVKPLEKGLANGASKCAFINNRQQLSGYLSKMNALKIKWNNLVCQQCVEGDNRWEYGYGGYFVNGKATIDICFHQFIQVPQGLCCYSREITDLNLEKKIKDLVNPFLEYTHYNGMIEFDIKQDANTKDLYLLDINPRPWRSADMLSAKLGDSTIFNPQPIREKVVWRYPYRELFARKNPKNISYSLCKSLTRGYKTVTHYTLSDKHDKKPSRMQLKEDLKDLIKKIKL